MLIKFINKDEKMPCPHSTKCELYVRFAADPSIEIWKKHYCSSDFKKCTRYDMSLKGMSIPLDMLPNGKRIATGSDSVDVGLNTLFNAIKKDRMPMVEAIIRVKAVNEDLTNSAGVGPAMFAASLGRKDMVELFFSKGCNPHKKSKEGKTALDYAVENNHTDCIEIIKGYMEKIPAPTENVRETEAETASAPSLFGRLFGFLRGSNQKAA
jgi:hypothetical protein